jgi:predicted  nucleic acid-binding Zn-ribbon protein
VITEEVFRKTEGRLYRYYWQRRQIDKLKHMVVVLWKQLQSIEQDIKQTNVTIEPESRSFDYSKVRVQTSNDGSSYAENEIIKELDKLHREWQRTKRRILKINAKIREFEKEIADIGYVISLLNEECKQFVELKYGESKSLYEIADRLNMGKSTAGRRREEIVEDVAKWLSQ